ncbi:hypothetical protein DVH24_004220 [Malus domestica]|uniref:Uncharacterized protein n=1 Tax=Malus domestica TaxID=3750 RepID=A0A498K833_MALDO|nr:hypothetical protein DVH24_004220 [Malus domestica]
MPTQLSSARGSRDQAHHCRRRQLNREDCESRFSIAKSRGIGNKRDPIGGGEINGRMKVVRVRMESLRMACESEIAIHQQDLNAFAQETLQSQSPASHLTL